MKTALESLGVRRYARALGKPMRLLLTIALLTALLLCVYEPVVRIDFLYRDDTVYLTLPLGWNMTPITFAQARPLLGVVIDCLNTSVIKGAGTKHLFALVGLGLIATSLFVWLVRYQISRLTALLISLSACCIPAFQATVPYLTVTAAVFAALASSLAVHVLCAPNARGQLWRCLLSGALVFTALSAYQPAAMFGWSYLIVPLYLLRRDELPAFRQQLLRFLAVFTCATICYVLFYKFVLHRSGMALSGRSEMVTLELLPSKLHWLASTLVPYSLQAVVSPALTWTANARSLTGIIALIVLVGGLLRHAAPLHPAQAILRLFERSGLLVAFLVMTYLPFVLLRENGMEALYGTGIQTALLLALLMGMRTVVHALPHRNCSTQVLADRVELAAVAVVCFCFATSASRLLLMEVALPNHNRYRFVSDAILAHDLTTTEQIYVVADEGFLGAYAEGLVRGVLNEAKPEGPHPPIASASRIAPTVIYIRPELAEQLYGARFNQYYTYDSNNGACWLKADLTPDQRRAADYCFAMHLKDALSTPSTLVIDLSARCISP